MNKRSATGVAIGWLLASTAIGAPLTVEVHGKLKPDSVVRVAAYGSAEQWLEDPSGANDRRVGADAVQKRAQAVDIADLAPGAYAIAVYVDENGNGELDRGLFGIPSEPYGFSRGGGSFGPPAFADALVEVPASGATIRVDLE